MIPPSLPRERGVRNHISFFIVSCQRNRTFISKYGFVAMKQQKKEETCRRPPKRFVSIFFFGSRYFFCIRFWIPKPQASRKAARICPFAIAHLRSSYPERLGMTRMPYPSQNPEPTAKLLGSSSFGATRNDSDARNHGIVPPH